MPFRATSEGGVSVGGTSTARQGGLKMRKGNQQSATFANNKKAISGKFAFGAALAVAGILAPHQRAAADQLDTVLQRLEALERSNAEPAKENAGFPRPGQRVEGAKVGAAPVAAAP